MKFLFLLLIIKSILREKKDIKKCKIEKFCFNFLNNKDSISFNKKNIKNYKEYIYTSLENIPEFLNNIEINDIVDIINIMFKYKLELLNDLIYYVVNQEFYINFYNNADKIKSSLKKDCFNKKYQLIEFISNDNYYLAYKIKNDIYILSNDVKKIIDISNININQLTKALFKYVKLTNTEKNLKENEIIEFMKKEILLSVEKEIKYDEKLLEPYYYILKEIYKIDDITYERKFKNYTNYIRSILNENKIDSPIFEAIFDYFSSLFNKLFYKKMDDINDLIESINIEKQILINNLKHIKKHDFEKITSFDYKLKKKFYIKLIEKIYIDKNNEAFYKLNNRFFMNKRQIDPILNKLWKSLNKSLNEEICTFSVNFYQDDNLSYFEKVCNLRKKLNL